MLADGLQHHACSAADGQNHQHFVQQPLPAAALCRAGAQTARHQCNADAHCLICMWRSFRLGIGLVFLMGASCLMPQVNLKNPEKRPNGIVSCMPHSQVCIQHMLKQEHDAIPAASCQPQGSKFARWATSLMLFQRYGSNHTLLGFRSDTVAMPLTVSHTRGRGRGGGRGRGPLDE